MRRPAVVVLRRPARETAPAERRGLRLVPVTKPRAADVAVASPKAVPRTAFVRLTRAITILAVLTLGFAVFQARIGNLTERRSQRELKNTLKEVLASGAGIGRDASGNAKPIPPGSAVAFLDVPRLGVNKAVVEGAGAEQLKRGPGLLAGAPLPGQTGHSIIVGRRTTYGSPFRHLELLSPGDEIKASTPFGKFTYKVRDNDTVEPGKIKDLAEADGGLLTLVTSDPPYVGGRALAVTATLQGDPSTFPDPLRGAAAATGTVDFGGNAGSRIGALVAGVLLMAALIGADALYQRWRRWTTYVLTTPVILALAFAWMQNLSSVLPASL